MFNILKNKKGWWPWAIIIGLVVAFLSAGVIWMAVSNYAGKAEDKTQVELCRTSNEIRVGTKELVDNVLVPHTPRVCITIDKTKATKSAIPTKNYPQNKEGAMVEIRDMIKDCWYMWLEGSEVNAFDGLNIIGSKGCHVCYMFELKDKSYLKGDNAISIAEIKESMLKPYFVKDTASDKCAFQGGFFEYDGQDCGTNGRYNLGYDLDAWKEVPSKEAKKEGANVKCCIRKDVPNECENRGGKCYTEEEFDDRDESLGFNNIYLKWYCPKTKQRCYVKEDDAYSYTKYIKDFGPRRGEVLFLDPTYTNFAEPTQYISTNVLQPDEENIVYTPGNIFAIAFASPVKECEDFWCKLKFGGKAAAGAIGIGALGVAGGTAIMVGLAIPGVNVVVAGALLGAAIGGGIAFGLSELGLLDDVVAAGHNTMTDADASAMPSFMIVSTLDKMQQIDLCSIT